MTDPKGFYELPRELRDQVYDNFFTLEGGYHHDHRTNKLLTEKGEMIDLNFRLASRQIAQETRGLALKLNAVSFSTAYDEELRERAGMFGTILRSIGNEQPRSFLHATNSTNYVWKDTPSLCREFIASALNTIAARPGFTDIVNQSRDWIGSEGYPNPAPVPIATHRHLPWLLLSTRDVEAMRNIIAPHPVEVSIGRPSRCWDKEKYKFSAATFAVRFLKSVSTLVRLEMRNVVLHENHVAVAWPECHGQGLIPFCQESSNLRISHRVNLWTGILPAASVPLVSISMETPQELVSYKFDRLRAHAVSRGDMGYGGVSGWIMEALRLPSLGMPTNAFTLVIDGEETPTNSTRVFDILQRDAARQLAYDECIGDRSKLPNQHSWLKIRDNEAYIMNGFPEALRAMHDGTSPVKCTFDIPPPHNPYVIVTQGRGWTHRDWLMNWRIMGQLQGDVHTGPPLPTWLDLRRRDMLSE